MVWPLNEGILTPHEGSNELKEKVEVLQVDFCEAGTDWKFGSVQDAVDISWREMCTCTLHAPHTARMFPSLLHRDYS